TRLSNNTLRSAGRRMLRAPACLRFRHLLVPDGTPPFVLTGSSRVPRSGTRPGRRYAPGGFYMTLTLDIAAFCEAHERRRTPNPRFLFGRPPDTDTLTRLGLASAVCPQLKATEIEDDATKRLVAWVGRCSRAAEQSTSACAAIQVVRDAGVRLWLSIVFGV